MPAIRFGRARTSLCRELHRVFKENHHMKSTLLAYGRVAALLAGTAVVGTFAATPASAAIQAGVLTCNVAGGVGAIVASQKAVSCTFKPSVNAPVEFYNGSFPRARAALS